MTAVALLANFAPVQTLRPPFPGAPSARGHYLLRGITRMASARLLHQRVSGNEQLAGCSLLARLLFTWGIPHASAYGVLTGRPERLKEKVLPQSSETSDEIMRAADELVARGLWMTFAAADAVWFYYPTWDTYQDIRGRGKNPRNGVPKPPTDESALLSHFPNSGSNPSSVHKVHEIAVYSGSNSGSNSGSSENAVKAAPEATEGPSAPNTGLQEPKGKSPADIGLIVTPSKEARTTSRSHKIKAVQADGLDRPPVHVIMVEEAWDTLNLPSPIPTRTTLYGQVGKLIQEGHENLLWEWLAQLSSQPLPPHAKPDAWLGNLFRGAARRPWEWQRKPNIRASQVAEPDAFEAAARRERA